MTRSFDRRGGYPSTSIETRLCWPEIDWNAVDAKRKEEALSDISRDCMCKNNDPECRACWEGSPLVAEDTDWAGKELGKFRREVVEFERDVRNRFDECLELLLRKHSDYGPANIANAPGGALNGLRVRMHDKLARINHLIDTGALPENESLRDSFVDLANYSVIALCVLDERWPTE